MAKYDIFISYRRDTGAQYARILQLMLQERGYRVFLDYDELTDGKFGEHIKEAIQEAPIFMLVLSKNAMVRCANEGDWVREEIETAIRLGKQIVPVNPDNQFAGVPENIPEDIKREVTTHQHSEVSFGQTLGITVDYLIEHRIVPHLGKRSAKKGLAEDFDAAREALDRLDRRNRFIKWTVVLGVVLVLALLLGGGWIFWQQWQQREQWEDLRSELEQKPAYQQFGLHFSPQVTLEQMKAVDRLLSHMAVVTPDSLWMSQFECSQADWHDIVGGDYDTAQARVPITNVSQGEILLTYIDSLSHLTGIRFDLPSAEEWELAARGGYRPDGTTYCGSNQVDQVAWYQGNSGGQVHPSDGQQGKEPNNIDLYDMSGNVSEITMTPALSAEGMQWTTCGGSVNSPAEGVTVTSRGALDADSKNSTTGFRLIIRKQ